MTTTPHRILFIIPTLTGGGAERVVVNLLRQLDRSKFHLSLAVVDVRGEAFLDDVPYDVEFIDLKCTRVRYALPKIVRLIWQKRPDVVFSTLGHLNLALAMLRPALPNGVRYVARETSIVSESLRCYALPELWFWAYRHFYHRFDSLVCQSFYMYDDLVRHFGFPAEKAVVIHNPIDIKRIRSLSAEPVKTGMENNGGTHSTQIVNLVAAGRLVHVKGFDLLIDALALCCNSNLRLTLLGEGKLRSKLESLAEEKCVSKQVRFAGFQRNPYPFFAQADAYVLSSRYEGFPNVVLEALACGTPVIATPAPGGVREILDDMAGCLLAEDVSAEGLANAIRKFSPGRRLSPVLVDAYDVSSIVKRYEKELYADAAL